MDMRGSQRFVASPLIGGTVALISCAGTRGGLLTTGDAAGLSPNGLRGVTGVAGLLSPAPIERLAEVIGSAGQSKHTGPGGVSATDHGG